MIDDRLSCTRVNELGSGSNLSGSSGSSESLSAERGDRFSTSNYLFVVKVC